MHNKNVTEENKKLRTGFTTGTCSTAASMASVLSIIYQKKIDFVEVELPKGNSIRIKIHSCVFEKNSAKCSVIKDGGDDPDVTHGAEIVVDVSITDQIGQIQINGGIGVGIVTKPGLGLEINKPAINPVPKKMIIDNLLRVGKDLLSRKGVNVTISVPKGKELAVKTDNPRLGIVGGISILGTSGIVIPFSTASYAASIRQNLDVSLAMGDKIVVLTTGGRSETFAKNIVDLPEHCFVQMGDFSGYTIQQCAKKNIEKAFVVGFIGKLAKMAMGVKQTHVKGSKVDMQFLADLVKKTGSDNTIVERVKEANTARHVLEIVKESKNSDFFKLLCKEVYLQMRKHSENKVPIEIILFDFDGIVLERYSE
ncbi:MAG: cobalt-precorrin-5B (C(1))-methyltransferase [Crenarchaeota archaeon]|nr:MAG: cobalt-precorrin-5B (C(1))-methyltransferase [Thermoproteota archaeon]RDJ33387.1 MAG: cobalt-precorrin-5B (C(1))-methyltransferase [Thermoproteota archaeon]RDJ36108.1 MAG: cobalt-precorrin-5B (C(1))-methyltransferase [Thermoproteota archaeon]RDJ38741.1 MAG: cobalt-precorrin-5B (C(1))-methyltransferase [Thermoproteota archaeon]